MGRRRATPPPPPDPIDTLLGSPVLEQLDLHGCSRDEARIKLESFITRCTARHSGGVVRIVTGRGNRSAEGPVLRGHVEWLLKGPLAPKVRRHQSDSGGGAFLVELR